MHNEIRYDDFRKFITAKLIQNLDKDLFYHGFHHTEYVMKVMEEIARNEPLDDKEMLLLRTAIWLHDSGFLETYSNHEEKGCEYARRWLPGYGYSQNNISTICGMIMATKVPQNPQNLLEYIIADADLEYLGTDQYDVVSDTLYRELLSKKIVQSEEQWAKIQVNFLTSHYYHTDFCINHREEAKQAHLTRLKEVYSL